MITISFQQFISYFIFGVGGFVCLCLIISRIIRNIVIKRQKQTELYCRVCDSHFTASPEALLPECPVCHQLNEAEQSHPLA